MIIKENNFVNDVAYTFMIQHLFSLKNKKNIGDDELAKKINLDAEKLIAIEHFEREITVIEMLEFVWACYESLANFFENLEKNYIEHVKNIAEFYREVSGVENVKIHF